MSKLKRLTQKSKFSSFFDRAEKLLAEKEQAINLTTLTKEVARLIMESLSEVESSMLADIRIKETEFLELNSKRWSEGLNLLKVLRQLSFEAGEDFVTARQIHPKFINSSLFGVLMRFHSSALRITSEIICLLEAGFPDGAYARWRALFELALNSLILIEHGEKAAIEYIKHSRGIMAETELKRHELTRSDSNKPLKAFDYKTLDYLLSAKPSSWQREFLKVGKIGKIIEESQLKSWHGEYLFSNALVHASSIDDRFLLAGSELSNNGMIIWKSDTGIGIPAHGTAVMLSIITCSLLTMNNPDDEDLDSLSPLVHMLLVEASAAKVSEHFNEIMSKH